MSSYRRINQVQGQFLPFLGSLEVRCVWHTALRPSHSRLMLGSSASAHLTFPSPCSISTISLHPGCPCRGLGFCPPCYPSKVCSVPAPSLDALLWVVGTKHPVSQSQLALSKLYSSISPEHRGTLPVLHSQNSNSQIIWSQLPTNPHTLTSCNNMAEVPHVICLPCRFP